MSDNNSFLVFSGTKTRYLAEKICASLGVPLGNLVRTQFSDGEFVVSYEQSIRGKDVFLVQSTFPNSDNLMELLLMIDAAKRASARQINAVIPYFGWARQDRKDKPRVSIGAKLIADLLSTAGIDRLITRHGAAVVTEDSISNRVQKFPTSVLNQWTYHSRLYAAAKYCTTQKDMDLVQLVSFGCGVDAITTDETREILQEGGKLYTQLKIDEITNLGAVRIRLRSLFAALEEQEET